MAIVGSEVLVDRIVALLRAELNAEVDLVDEGANALSSGDAVFETEEIHDEDFIAFVDRRQGSPLRVLVFEQGRTHEERGRVEAIEGAPGNLPRMDTRHRIVVRVVVISRTGTWSPDGAARRCGRISTAVATLLARFPQLSVPSLGLAPFPHAWTTLEEDDRTKGVEEQDSLLVMRDLVFKVATLENRS